MSWRELLTYWRGKCRDGRPPMRTEIDPLLEIPHLLKHLFMMDVAGDRFRYRLIGSFIVSRARRDSTGHWIDEQLMPKPELETWLTGLRKVTRTRQPLLAVARPSQGLAVEFTAIVLPLVDRNGATELIFGGLFNGHDSSFQRSSDLSLIHGLVEYVIPDQLDDQVLPILRTG